MTFKPSETSPRAKADGKSDPSRVEDLPLSRPFCVSDLPEGGIDIAIEASATERAELARMDGLAEIKSLRAAFHVVPIGGKGVNVSGQVTASIVQFCVVSLETFEAEVEEPVDVDFLPETLARSQEAPKGREPEVIEVDEGDEPDAIIDGKIDLGALAAEFLALSLDPYPRKPGAVFAEISTDAADGGDSPFAVLKNWEKGQ